MAASRSAAAPAPGCAPPWRGRYPSATEFLLDKIKATKNNNEFFDSMQRG